jgi:hypothetical protein
VIKEVSLINPNIVWPQDAGGRWKLPGSHRKKTAPPTVSQPGVESEPAPTSQTQTAPVVAISPPNLPSPAQAIVNKPSPMQEPRLAVPPEVRRVSIKNGNFSFLDHAGRLLASFNGVDFRRPDYRRRRRTQGNRAGQIGGQFPGFRQNGRSGGVRW